LEPGATAGVAGDNAFGVDVACLDTFTTGVTGVIATPAAGFASVGLNSVFSVDDAESVLTAVVAAGAGVFGLLFEGGVQTTSLFDSDADGVVGVAGFVSGSDEFTVGAETAGAADWPVAVTGTAGLVSAGFNSDFGIAVTDGAGEFADGLLSAAFSSVFGVAATAGVAGLGALTSPLSAIGAKAEIVVTGLGGTVAKLD
jgi:hypothetical protein